MVDRLVVAYKLREYVDFELYRYREEDHDDPDLLRRLEEDKETASAAIRAAEERTLADVAAAAWPPGLKTGHVYRLRSDSEPPDTAWLQVVVAEDGDVHVSLWNKPTDRGPKEFPSIRVCTRSGGGRSPAARQLLLWLAAATEEALLPDSATNTVFDPVSLGELRQAESDDKLPITQAWCDSVFGASRAVPHEHPSWRFTGGKRSYTATLFEEQLHIGLIMNGTTSLVAYKTRAEVYGFLVAIAPSLVVAGSSHD